MPSSSGVAAAAAALTEPAPPVPTAATPPSNSRALVRQSSRSFASRSGATNGKDKEVPDGGDTAPPSPAAGSSSTPALPPSVEVSYAQIGLAPPVLTETAGQARTRFNANEGKLAVYTTSLEARVNALSSSTMRRDDDILRALTDYKAALDDHIRTCGRADGSSSDTVRALYTAVGENRSHIAALAAIPREINTLRAEVTSLAARAPAGSTPPVPVPVLPPLPAIAPPSTPSTVPARRALPDPVGPPAKRAHVDRGDTDVIYGPVNAKLVPVTAAKGAMAFVDGLSARDVQNARAADRRPNYISIRFTSAAKASTFVTAIRDRPFLPDQVAVFASSVTDQEERLTLEMLRATEGSLAG